MSGEFEHAIDVASRAAANYRCAECKADIGEPCTKSANGEYHLSRLLKSINNLDVDSLRSGLEEKRQEHIARFVNNHVDEMVETYLFKKFSTEGSEDFRSTEGIRAVMLATLDRYTPPT